MKARSFPRYIGSRGGGSPNLGFCSAPRRLRQDWSLPLFRGERRVKSRVLLRASYILSSASAVLSLEIVADV